MPISGLLQGLEGGFAQEVAAARAQQRAREDADFQKQLSLLELVRSNPTFMKDQGLYQRVLADTLKLQKGQSTNRKNAPGMSGFFGATDTAPYASDVLKGISDGSIKAFHPDKPEETAKAAAPLGPQTINDIHAMMASQGGGGGGSQAGSGVPSPPPPSIPTPPSQPGAPTGPSQAVAPGGGQAPTGGSPTPSPLAGPPPPQGPQGPIPQPPGTASMLGAATGLADQVNASGPIVVPPSNDMKEASTLGAGATIGSPPASSSVEGYQPGPNVLFRTDEQQARHEAYVKGISARATLLADTQNMADAMRSQGVPEDIISKAVTQKLTNFRGAISSHPFAATPAGGGPAITLVEHSDPYGNTTVTDLAGNPAPAGWTPFKGNQLITGKEGQVTSVNKVTGETSSVGSGKPIGKPYTPPPGGPVVITPGANGQPEINRLSRTGTEITPVTTPGGQQATKWIQQKPYSQAAISILEPAQIVHDTAEEALSTIQQLTDRGVDPKSVLGQEAMKKIYTMGWIPSGIVDPKTGELEAHLFQMVGANEANALKTVMGGRPSQRLIDILQMHTAQAGDDLDLLKEKLTGLVWLSNKVHAAVDKSEALYRPQPWDKPGAPGGIAPPPPPTPKQVLSSDVLAYANHFKISEDAARAIFINKNYTIVKPGPAKK